MAQNPRRAANMLPNAATHPQFLRSQAARNDAASSSGHVPCHGEESLAPQRSGTSDSLFATPAGGISLLRRYREALFPHTTSAFLLSRQGFDPSPRPFPPGVFSELGRRARVRPPPAHRRA